MVEAVVEYHYEAQEPDELSLKKGDIISNIVKKPGGWWEGTLARIGKRGMFPDNFVKVLGGDKKTADAPIKGGRYCKVLFAYAPSNPDELELKVGDIIEVLGEVEEGWWKGKYNGVIGVFPSNFVAEYIPDSPTVNSTEVKKHKTSLDDSSKINFNSNINAAGNGGHDEVKVHHRHQQPSETTISSLAMTKGGSNDGSGDPPLPALPPKPYKEQCQVMFPYTAANDDELTLEEGDVITIISKEAADDGWWTGELKGQIGVFPDNFVKLITPLNNAQHSNQPMTTMDDSKIGVKTKSSGKESISKSSSSASVYMAAAAAAANANQSGTASVSRKYSDSIRHSDEKVSGLNSGVGKKPPPPLKKPIGALSPGEKGISSGGSSQVSSVAAAIAKTEAKQAAVQQQLNKEFTSSSSTTSSSRSTVQNIVSSVSAAMSKQQNTMAVTSTGGNSTISTSGVESWTSHITETSTSAMDSHDGISFSRQSYSVTTSSGNAGSGVVSLNNGTITPFPQGDLDLDSVGRAAMLTHPTASRAKVPKRRPPSALLQREESREELAPGNRGETQAPPSGDHSMSSTMVNGSTDQAIVKKIRNKTQSWVEELRDKQKLADAKKGLVGGKTRVMIGASSTEETTSSSAGTTTSVSGVTLRQTSSSNAGAVRPLSLHSRLPASSEPLVLPSSSSASSSPSHQPSAVSSSTTASATGGASSSTDTITVPLPQWNQLCNKVSKLEALVELQREELKSKLREVMEAVESQALKQRKMLADLEKLTDLVTQV